MAEDTTPQNPYARDDYPANLELEWLMEKKLPIFIRNITRPRGQIAINFPNINGRTKVIKIPRTHLPVRLSGQMSYDTIMMSDDLRQCMYKGVIELVRPDHAWVELQDPDAEFETDRMQLSQFSAKNTFVSKRVQDMEETVANKVDPNAPQLQALGVETNVLNPRILNFVEKLKSGDLPVKSAISELKTMAGELTDSDCAYIVANGPPGQVRSYVQKVLADLRGSEAASAPGYKLDDVPEMTEEERRKEAQRESMARQTQVV